MILLLEKFVYKSLAIYTKQPYQIKEIFQLKTMSFQWSDMDSKYTMFEKNVDVFNKDGFKIIELPKKNVINDFKKEEDNFVENDQEEEKSLEPNINFSNKDVSNNAKEKVEDAENEEKMKKEKKWVSNIK